MIRWDCLVDVVGRERGLLFKTKHAQVSCLFKYGVSQFIKYMISFMKFILLLLWVDRVQGLDHRHAPCEECVIILIG